MSVSRHTAYDSGGKCGLFAYYTLIGRPAGSFVAWNVLNHSKVCDLAEDSNLSIVDHKYASAIPMDRVGEMLWRSWELLLTAGHTRQYVWPCFGSGAPSNGERHLFVIVPRFLTYSICFAFSMVCFMVGHGKGLINCFKLLCHVSLRKSHCGRGNRCIRGNMHSY